MVDPAASSIWTHVDRWIAGSNPVDPAWYGIAAWRAEVNRSGPAPEPWGQGRRANAMIGLTAPVLLARIQQVTGQQLLLLKGPEVAAAYPAPGMRPYGDLDILVADLPVATAALLAAGFVQIGTPGLDDLPGYFHDLALRLPGSPLAIELHRAPGWLSWMTPPANGELFLRSVPSATGVHGVRTLAPEEHTLYLAAHSWRHGPFHSLLHMLDIALMQIRCDPVALRRTAARWGMAGIWNHTARMVAWCFSETETTLSPLERIWSRHLRAQRRRTLREYYLATRTKALAADTPQDLLSGLASDAAWSLSLRPGENPGSVIRYAMRGLASSQRPPITAKRRA